MKEKPITHNIENPAMSQAHRRTYTVIPMKVSPQKILTARVTWKDFDRNNVPLTNGGGATHDLDLTSVKSSGEAIEILCRIADPRGFRTSTSTVQDTSWETLEEVRYALEGLRKPENRNDGEPPPHPDSVSRLLEFMKSRPDIVSPVLFSSKDGTLRARWNHGADRTVFIGFPKDGPLPISVRIPRQGDYGLLNAQARVIEDKDVPQFLALLGVRITKS
jgi:hypothetical protein